jgi:hypothetical protein
MLARGRRLQVEVRIGDSMLKIGGGAPDLAVASTCDVRLPSLRADVDAAYAAHSTRRAVIGAADMPSASAAAA